jgi:hypothetical protein
MRLRRESTARSKPLRGFPALTVLAALTSTCFAAVPTVQGSPPPAQTAPASSEAPAPQALPKICLDAQTSDPLTQAFASRLREAIATSGTLSLASTAGMCDLQLHVPGNLLRFETAGGVMASTVVIVTSSSGRYLSASITACQANVLEPCAARAVAATKLALLMSANAEATDSAR